MTRSSRSKKTTNNNNIHINININTNKKSSKRKKPKFLSLRHINLNAAAAAAAAEEETSSAAADFFAASVDPSLSSLFEHSLTCADADVAAHDSTTTQQQQQHSCSLTGGVGNGEEDLVRTAMRRGREEREEKWVCYEEVTSCCCVVAEEDDNDDDDDANVHRKGKSGRMLSLKLDYQEIIDAWCDKGPFYMPGPQIVPDLSLDFGLNDGWGSNGAMWTVPENTVGVKVEHELEEELKIRHREASVLRYKEKRQSRLFSKRIRYEVRKINAEKRPRMKGRFVKRN